MVLQDKYKARASAKYRATHGMAPKERGRGQGRGRGRGRGRGGLAHGRPVPQGGSGSGGNGSDQEGTDEEGEEIQGEANEQAEFPTLRAAATHHAATPPKTEEELAAEEETKAERRKYSRRPLQSNAWRFEQLQADSTPQDPRLATEEQQQEPEPEEDLTELLEKIKRLDTSKQELDDGIFARRRSKKPEQPTTVDPAELEHRKQEIEQDIDHELDYLKDRKQARAQAHAKRAIRNDGGNRNAATTRKVLTKEEMQKELEILAEIEKNKQHAEHLRSTFPIFLPCLFERRS